MVVTHGDERGRGIFRYHFHKSLVPAGSINSLLLDKFQIRIFFGHERLRLCAVVVKGRHAVFVLLSLGLGDFAVGIIRHMHEERGLYPLFAVSLDLALIPLRLRRRQSDVALIGIAVRAALIARGLDIKLSVSVHMEDGKDHLAALVFKLDDIVAHAHGVGIFQLFGATREQRIFISSQEVENLRVARRIVRIKGFSLFRVERLRAGGCIFRKQVLLPLFPYPEIAAVRALDMFAVVIAESISPIDLPFFKDVGEREQSLVARGRSAAHGVARDLDEIGLDLVQSLFDPS